ncbi:hypothetical protein G3I61_35445 [Streptomyces diastaticus]|nr:hypothetical protein [Streptomyces diastaticus]
MPEETGGARPLSWLVRPGETGAGPGAAEVLGREPGTAPARCPVAVA